MTADPPTATAINTDDDEEFTLLVPALLEADAFGTSDHIGFSTGCRVASDTGKTTWFMSGRAMIKALAGEVEQLRDRVGERTGLTRQEIARAIGVDRRSLSGFVTGEIRPTEVRMLALRALADNADWTVEQFGEHAREVLRGKSPESSPLRLIAEGRTDIRRELQAAAEQAGLGSIGRVTIQSRASREPLYLKAASAWSTTGHLPSRLGTPRDDAEYDQDLSKAAAAPMPPPERPRRRQI
jgi:transcriptional regulator with XRE-family HTH domain